jgi:histone H2A
MKSKKEDMKKKAGTQISLQTETDKKDRQTLSSKAQLLFPVARVLKKMKQGRYADRISTSSAVSVAAVLEYLTAEILEMSGDKCFNGGNRINNVIKPRHICLAVNEDEEMNMAIGKNVIIPMGGVIPFIHEELEKQSKRTKKKNKTLEGMKDDMADEEDEEDDSTDSDED